MSSEDLPIAENDGRWSCYNDNEYIWA